MRCAADLHIHSCLSPCADDDMTPNNIAGMAYLKGLSLIAVCDHNSAFNLPAVEAAARLVGVGLVPGMELTTREEAHLLAYFPDVETALQFGQEVYRHLPDLPNRPDLFGRQLVLDENDEPVREEPRLLISALNLSLDELVAKIDAAGGAAVPAHINRGANGVLQALGFVPANVHFFRAGGVEWSALSQWGGGRLPPVALLRRAPIGRHTRTHIHLRSGRANGDRIPSVSRQYAKNQIIIR